MATITADSVSAADVQAAITASSDGDTVLIPAGEADYDDSHKVTCTKGITIQGNGIDSTIIYDKTGSAYNNEPFLITTKTGYTTYITGITFDGANSGGGMGMVKIDGSTYNTGNFRVHHNKFTNIKYRGLVINKVYGLIDSNTFYAPYSSSAQPISLFGDGSTAWERALSLGTVNAVYIEDNTITMVIDDCDGCMDAYNGARFVFRYNTITNTLIGWHGCDSGGYRSPVSFEIYHNDFTSTISTGGRGLHSRGGTGVIYSNTWTGSGYLALDMQNYRSIDANEALVGAWGLCDGDSVYDANQTGLQGYHCQDQCGWAPSGTDDGSGPNQISRPLYAWSNTKSGSNFPISVVNTDRNPLHIVENRDFYDYESSFDGTVGVGVGLKAARPATCTTGVGYWATDESKLYWATGTNTWAEYYSPYSYPHPLRVEALLEPVVSETMTVSDSLVGTQTSPPSFGSPSKFTRAFY